MPHNEYGQDVVDDVSVPTTDDAVDCDGDDAFGISLYPTM